MLRNPFCNFILAGVNLNTFGHMIPSPFSTLSIENSEITSMTSWTLRCIICGDDKRKINIAAFEALLYSAAQSANGYSNSSGIPVSFAFGWLDSRGNIGEYTSYQGFTLNFKVSTSGLYMIYDISGYASLAIQSSVPVLNIPELSGIVQPSAVLEALAIGIKATDYYELDVDHNDAPTLVEHNAFSTSFNSYVRGSYNGQDDYDSFPGLLKLSKSYNSSREAAGLIPQVSSLSQVLNNATVTPVENFLKKSITDESVQCSSFSYWVDEPTMTQPGVIHYKSNAALAGMQLRDTLEYGTANSNILSLSGSYSGVAYNISDMNFQYLGFSVDGSGNTVVNGAEVVNSWSATLADTFQAANIINDVNALATQFSGDFVVVIPGSVKTYALAQPVSLLVMSGNTVSPITGIYNIMSVGHTISDTFVTTLKIQRLVMSSANQVATSQNIYVSGAGYYPSNSFVTTSNVISPYRVDFGTMYPTFQDIGQLI